MNFDVLMQSLAQRLQLDALPLGDDGLYRLRLDEHLLYRMAESPETQEWVLMTELFKLPTDEAGQKFMRLLLGANYRWAFSARGHFGMHPQTGMVEYCLRESLLGLDADRLERQLQSVTAVLATVLRELRSSGAAANQEAATGVAEPPTNSLIA